MTTTTPLPSEAPAGSSALAVAAERDGAEPGLTGRLTALESLVTLGTDRLEPALLDTGQSLLDRAGQRMRLSGEHTVVTLAGGTGSGKSSLFNAVCGLDLS